MSGLGLRGLHEVGIAMVGLILGSGWVCLTGESGGGR